MFECVPQIYSQDKENLNVIEPHASGVLLHDSNYWFLVTAGHVLNRMDKFNLLIFVNNIVVNI